MKTKLSVAAALGGTLLAICLVSGSAQATSLPVLKSNASDGGIVTLVGRRGGGFSGGRSFRGAGGRVNVGNVGARRYYGGGVGKRVNVGNVNRRYYGTGVNRRYAYNNNNYPYRRYGHRRFGWGLPYVTAGYAGGCGWLYRRAISTGSSYWWNRYNVCVG
jgi:hypothetical protein